MVAVCFASVRENIRAGSVPITGSSVGTGFMLIRFSLVENFVVIVEPVLEKSVGVADNVDAFEGVFILFAGVLFKDEVDTTNTSGPGVEVSRSADELLDGAVGK